MPAPYLPSKYIFLKNFVPLVQPKNFYYCPDCLQLLNLNAISCFAQCSSCQENYSENNLKRNGNYFVHIPIGEQLRNLLSEELFYKLKRSNEDNSYLSDVDSGKFYRNLRKQRVVGNNDITIQFNIDGVQTFKSSKVSMCPIQIMINELPYKLRKENVILAGLWASSQKPDMDIYLNAFVEELKELHEKGFQCKPPGYAEPITIKVHTILAPVDSVARPSLMNMHQFNGKYGCHLCLHPGRGVATGKGRARIYCGDVGSKRTAEEFEENALQAADNVVNPDSERKDDTVNGVKGVTLLSTLPVFNIIKSFPPEYMHSLLLGVVKTFLKAWFDSKHHEEEWYLGDKRNLFDEKMREIKPPSEITRTPRSISDLKRWKASEFKNFLIYYSLPVLKGLMRKKYYQHWFLLVYSITTFISEFIPQRNFEIATLAIRKFVLNVERLYAADLMKFNVHLMLHLPDTVKNFGALWAWSAFPYEAYNYVLRQMLKNSQCIIQQVCKSYLRLQNIKFHSAFEENGCNQYGKELYLRLVGGYKFKKTGRVRDNKLVTLGLPKEIRLNVVEKICIENFIAPQTMDGTMKFQMFERFIYNGIICDSHEYTRIEKRCNSAMKLFDGSFIQIKGILKIETITGDEKWLVLAKKFQLSDEVLCTYGSFSSGLHSSVVHKIPNNTVVALPNYIIKKCVLVPLSTGDKIIITPIVNQSETD